MNDVIIYALFALISFGASMIGAICGIGGGVLIKPLLDMFGLMDVSAISFLSGCTVLVMSSYSVIKGLLSGNSLVNFTIGTPLAIGAAVGGIAGKSAFQAIAKLFGNATKVGLIQAICLLILTAGTLLYTLKRKCIHTFSLTNSLICALIGLSLGIFSSFLGIGGGPINLVILCHFFSMNTKTAAQNSLYIICASQLSSLLMTITTKSVPDVAIVVLILMVLGGCLGGIVGRKISQKISDQILDRLFMGVMAGIILICIYNIAVFSELFIYSTI